VSLATLGTYATSVRVLPDRLDPGNAEARSWLRAELAKPAYRDTRDPVTRAIDAVIQWLENLLSGVHAPTRPLPTFVAGVVAVLLLALVAYMLRFVRRTQRLDSGPSTTVLGPERLTAAQYRARAQQALARGRYAACLLDLLRAIAQDAMERTLLEDAPSLTAHEIADRLAVVFPASAVELRWAAGCFDAVAYGDGTATRADAERMVALDHATASARPVRPHDPGGAGQAGSKGELSSHPVAGAGVGS
jgi:hypothetical protein